jgi:hypothetical protein
MKKTSTLVGGVWGFVDRNGKKLLQLKTKSSKDIKTRASVVSLSVGKKKTKRF